MRREKSVFLDVVGDSPTMRIMQFMIEGRHFDYMLTDLARDGEVSWGTLNKLFPKLVSYGLIKEVRKVGRATLYTINRDNPTSKSMMEMYDNIIAKTLMEHAEKLRKRRANA